MRFFWPFSSSGQTGESGNVLLVTGLIASAMAVAGGKVMLDRTLAQRKANQVAENTKRAKEIPGSAAMIAKALIALPPAVAANKSGEWTANKLLSTPANRPLIYPIPYVSGTVGGAAQSATSVSQTSAPSPGANWDRLDIESAAGDSGVISSASVNVYTNDSSRASTQDVNSAISSKSVVGGSATIRRTKSVVTYSFRNCNDNNQTSPTFTGRYCASAIITSDNYATTPKGNDAPVGPVNKVAVELGSIEPPPPPVIQSVSTSDNGPLRRNTNFSLRVRANGVATGYTVKYGATVLETTLLPTGEKNHKRLSLDHPYETRDLVISNINYNSVLNAAFDDPCQNSIELQITLHGISGPDPTFPQSFDIAKTLVSCVPGSFTVSRTGTDKRSCSLLLSKDNGSGIVQSVAITQRNNQTNLVTNHPFLSPSFSPSNQWSNPTVFACSEDSLTFNGALERQASCPTPSISQCTPANVTIPELDPVCSTFSVGRTPGSIRNCTLTVDRAPESHSVVDVYINNALQSGGSWSGNRWTMTNYNCGVSGASFTARLVRGARSSSCTSTTNSVASVDWCQSGSTFVSRVTGNPARCTMRVTKNSAASESDITGVSRDGTALGLASGTWSGHFWTSQQFDCGASQQSYIGALTGSNDETTSCGAYTLPAQPPSCTFTSASRLDPNSTTCTINLSMNATSGPISDVLINGTAVTGTWNETAWTGQTSCAAAGAVLTGSMRNSAGDTATCGVRSISPTLCYNAPAFEEFTVEGSSSASQTISINSPTRACYNYVSAVCVGGGGGGRNENGDDDSGGGGGALAWFANRPLVDTDSYSARGGQAGPYGSDGVSSWVKVGTRFIILANGGGSSSGAGGTFQTPSASATATWIGRNTGVTFGGGNGGRGGFAYLIGGVTPLSPGGGGGAGGYSGNGGNGANGQHGNGASGVGGAGGGGGTGCDGAGKGGGVSLYGGGVNGVGGTYSGPCRRSTGQRGTSGSPGSPSGSRNLYGGGSAGPAENNNFLYSDPGGCRVIFSVTQWNWLVQP